MQERSANDAKPNHDPIMTLTVLITFLLEGNIVFLVIQLLGSHDPKTANNPKIKHKSLGP